MCVQYSLAAVCKRTPMPRQLQMLQTHATSLSASAPTHNRHSCELQAPILGCQGAVDIEGPQHERIRTQGIWTDLRSNTVSATVTYF
jgi:hypothetical protein